MFISTTWNDLKNQITIKNLPYSHVADDRDSSNIWVWATDGPIVLRTYLLADSSDKTDFDNNYLAKSNTKPITKYRIIKNTITLSCNTSTWVEFYSYTFTNTSKFIELWVILNNNHQIKIELDNVSIFEGKIENMENLGTSMSAYIKYESSPYRISLLFNKHFGNTIKIYQKHNTGTGNLTIYGYNIIYAN